MSDCFIAKCDFCGKTYNCPQKLEWTVLDSNLVDNAMNIATSKQFIEDKSFDTTECSRPPWLIPGQRSGCGIYDVMINCHRRSEDHVLNKDNEQKRS